MIVELAVENFKSFLKSATVSFAAGTTSRLAGNLLRHQNGERFVKSMALYGPNASGKTTVVDALYALKRFVLFSTEDQKPTSRIARFEPFALDNSSSKRPSRIALTVDLEGDRYRLAASATAAQVWNETLEVQRITKQPSRRAATQVLIERAWNPDTKDYSTTLHEDLGSALTRRAAIEQTTPNRLMLGKLASMNSDVARRIIEWFDESLSFHGMYPDPVFQDAALTETASLLKEDRAFAAIVTRFMKDADTGIQGLNVIDESVYEPAYSELDKKFAVKRRTKPKLAFQHATEDGSEVFFRQHQESSGTLRFVALLAAILYPSPRRRLICIDEISASMHPDLVRRLVRIVHSSCYNRLGNQLLFTTHDTHLMDPNGALRRDQVAICSKDHVGRSSIRRLDEFQDAARSDANLQKQYLQGRFGGTPQFGPTLEDVAVDDEPLETGR